MNINKLGYADTPDRSDRRPEIVCRVPRRIRDDARAPDSTFYAFPTAKLAQTRKTLGASAASERRVVMAVLRGYRQALACAQSA